MCADPERGHIFTDRLLHARGRSETLFLGSDSIRPLIARLVPGIEFVTRPRLSHLSYSGPRKLARLPPKSAVVAFSASEVYAMAEYVRRGRGGAAVVLGALSPRTRNAQIGLYQAGEVEYIVATDAIGMGLNMDVDHVAFASLRKFDGRAPRPLAAAEVAQIAGRAGRHMNDGTFGATADLQDIPDEIVTAVEGHTFPPLKTLIWRNRDLVFTSVPALIGSLERPPDQAGLARVAEADDLTALKILAQDEAVAAKATGTETIRLLWDVCQIPDFRKVMAENHTRLLSALYRHLTGPGRRLPTDYMAAQVKRLDRIDGDIDTLMGRIAATRTWTYIAHRSDWIVDPGHWQGTTRQIEDRLSDALHEALTQRFIDRRTAVLIRRLKDPGSLMGDVSEDGQVRVEGQAIGQLDGFRFVSDEADGVHAAKAVLAAAALALKPEIAQRAKQLALDENLSFRLTDDGQILWRGQTVAVLRPGQDLLTPKVDALSSDLLDPTQRDRIRQRTHTWVGAFIAHEFGPLTDIDATGQKGPVRGILHCLAQSLGSVALPEVAALIRSLTDDDRRALKSLQVRLGRRHVFVPALFKPKPMRLRRLLLRVAGRNIPTTTAPAALSFPVLPGLSLQDHAALGYGVAAASALRIDKLDKVLVMALELAKDGKPFAAPAALHQMLGIAAQDLPAVMTDLGYAPSVADGKTVYAALKPERPKRGQRSHAPSDSPFAVLKTRR
jgi:ATP-dependent RNA helicase SUPV3L1/SUV3